MSKGRHRMDPQDAEIVQQVASVNIDDICEPTMENPVRKYANYVLKNYRQTVDPVEARAAMKVVLSCDFPLTILSDVPTLMGLALQHAELCNFREYEIDRVLLSRSSVPAIKELATFTTDLPGSVPKHLMRMRLRVLNTLQRMIVTVCKDRRAEKTERGTLLEEVVRVIKKQRKDRRHSETKKQARSTKRA